jgi:membrane protease YdiL (CAAX protease family)
MYEENVRKAAAVIVVIGQLLHFIGALLLGIFGPLRGNDLLQVIFLGSPILAATAFSGFKYVIDNRRKKALGLKVTVVFSTLILGAPLILASIIFFLYYLTYIQFTGFGPDQLKFSLGITETFMGVYIGAVGETLFAPTPKKA